MSRPYDSPEDDDRRRDKFSRERGGGDYDRNGRDYSNGAQKRPATSRRDDFSSKRGRIDSETDGRSEEPVMLTFKKFLSTCDDNISEEDAISKYAEYKADFKRQQLLKFFETHKGEEWFRQKYHPDVAKKLRDEWATAVRSRLDVFQKLEEQGDLDISLDLSNNDQIVRLLDTVVVMLEGGGPDDLAGLKADVSEEGKEDGETEGKKKNANLHKTLSVCLRNLPADVTQEEMETICKRSPGFLRFAFSEPQPDKNFARRGWATFKHGVNIKEICWNLNAIRIREGVDMSAIINKEIQKRLKVSMPLAGHKSIAIEDLKHAVKLAAMLDKRVGSLWGEEETPDDEREKDIRLGVDLVSASENPIVKKVKSLLMDLDADEMSPEEEELLRRTGGGATANGDSKTDFVRDEDVLKSLDELVMYLRIVHSVDFYAPIDYPNEDHMPHRLGILHVRGDNPEGQISNKDIQETRRSFVSRLEASDWNKSYVPEEELNKLGKKDGEKEVETFILANTVELAKEKWLCPLSGKKFKGPEFIRKHLQSKHEDKLIEVQQEADFFNNYLRDPKRPIEAEKPKEAPSRDRERGDREDDRREDRYRGDYDRRAPARSYGGPPSRDYSGGRPRHDDRRDPRHVVTYRDLDAPEDIA